MLRLIDVGLNAAWKKGRAHEIHTEDEAEKRTNISIHFESWRSSSSVRSVVMFATTISLVLVTTRHKLYGTTEQLFPPQKHGCPKV